jgi:hypothetical protein
VKTRRHPTDIEALRARIARQENLLKTDPTRAAGIHRQLAQAVLDSDRHELAGLVAMARVNARGSALAS